MSPASDAKSFPLILSRRDGGTAAEAGCPDGLTSVSAGSAPVAAARGVGPHNACEVPDSDEHQSRLEAVGAAHRSDAVHQHRDREWLDRIGIVLSVVCAIHCALTPILVAVAPFLFTSEFEFRTKAVLLSLASVALGWGYVTHRSLKPIVWLGLALVAFGVGEWLGHGERHGHGEWLEVIATVLASLALIAAHVTNARACRVAAPHGHDSSWLRRLMAAPLRRRDV